MHILLMVYYPHHPAQNSLMAHFIKLQAQLPIKLVLVFPQYIPMGRVLHSSESNIDLSELFGLKKRYQTGDNLKFTCTSHLKVSSLACPKKGKKPVDFFLVGFSG